MIALLSLTLLLVWPSNDVGHHVAGQSLASPDSGSLSVIRVAVFAPVDVTDYLVSVMCAETDAIWSPAGITFEWHRIISTDAGRTWSLDVTIDERRQDTQEREATLGWIPFTADGPQPSIHLSRSNAEELLLRRPRDEDKTIASHETLLGRALGRALSHELGHYLLRSKAHTPHGLMRAVRSSDEFFRVSRDGFEPSAEEREVAALQVRQEKPTEKHR